jgi:ankyrin repeat protein
MKPMGATFEWFRTLALDEDTDAMAAMLDGGFDVDALNDAHQTALMHSCANNRPRAVKFLVARGAGVNLADSGGTTAMDFALRHASRDLCDGLAAAGGRAGGTVEASRDAAAGHGPH